MAFSESLKLSVRRRAHFRCCVCRSVGVEIHHVQPQENGGPDTEENAAPLCPSCHEIYGANPTKRKFIREARDFWYEQCGATQSSGGLSAADLNAALAPVATKSDLEEIKGQLSRLLGASSHDFNLVTSENFQSVPLERFIRSLYEEDFGNRLSGYDLLFDSRMWYERGEDSYDLIDRRAALLKAYGEETAKRLCLTCAKDVGFDPERFTEDDLAKTLHSLIISVVLITQHRKHAPPDEEYFECGIRSDGEFMWRIVRGKKRSSRRSKAKTPRS